MINLPEFVPKRMLPGKGRSSGFSKLGSHLHLSRIVLSADESILRVTIFDFHLTIAEISKNGTGEARHLDDRHTIPVRLSQTAHTKADVYPQTPKAKIISQLVYFQPLGL